MWRHSSVVAAAMCASRVCVCTHEDTTILSYIRTRLVCNHQPTCNGRGQGLAATKETSSTTLQPEKWNKIVMLFFSDTENWSNIITRQILLSSHTHTHTHREKLAFQFFFFFAWGGNSDLLSPRDSSSFWESYILRLPANKSVLHTYNNYTRVCVSL